MRSARISLVPAYLLHQMPWRDSSRILEFFTRAHGRVSLFARGVRRERSEARPLLQPFQRLLVSWTGRGEAGTLAGVERDGERTVLPPNQVLSGFYLSELLLKLLARHDAHPQLFDDYAAALQGLAAGAAPGRCLRIFEKRLLQALGLWPDCDRETSSGTPLQAERHYHFRPERGVEAAVSETPATYQGASLLSLAGEELCDEQSLRDARRLLRAALDACLEGRSLKSREVLTALRKQEIKL
ncbi:MAG TPA: DNA repair protein RecO [Steroidobacteraceae bacterium]|jgi:DNA repair protein RecO (recombination protein O)